jgi:sugar/nucleoside kinase (ribokinase family)
MTELLIVGGLTIDRFADGSSAAGGSVIHAGRAAVADGVRPAFLTVAGEEPEALGGLEQLAAMGDLLRLPSTWTTTFAHAERDGRRLLALERRSAPIDLPRAPAAAAALLAAPIADELPASVLGSLIDATGPSLVVCLIQGWLRHLEPGTPVRPLALSEVADATWAVLGSADVVVVSTEDLAEAPGDPFTQAATLRASLGDRPVLVLTLGTQGHLLDEPSANRVVASMPRRVVTGVPTVGAGDTFGAALAIQLARGLSDPTQASEVASDRVIAMLETRRS